MIVDAVHEPFSAEGQQSNAYRSGMWIFLASELMLFGVLFLIYWLARMNNQQAFSVAGAETDKIMGTLNTFVLLTSSLTMALAVKRRRPTKLLLMTAVLGMLFIGIKLTEWIGDYHKGYLPGPGFQWTKPGTTPRGAELFYYLYFALTGIHLVHLTLAVCMVMTLCLFLKRGYQIPQEVELGGLYWHFVDIVWVFLYPFFYLIPK